MRSRLILLSAALVLCLQAQHASAVQVEGLYETEVPVASQDAAERRRALRIALSRILIKVSGRPGVVQNPNVAESLKDPARYVQQYRYRVPTDDGGGGGQPGSQQVLWTQFDREAVNRLLKQSGLTVWGRERPAVLVWLAVEERGRRKLIGSDEGGELVVTLQARASDRGIPLVLPLLDLEDQSRLRVTDVWGDFHDTVRAASGRYVSDAVLVARAYKVLPGLWEARWTLLEGSDAQRWATQSDTVGGVLEEGVDRVADTLAARFARPITEDTPGLLELVVTDVNSLEDYARVSRYLGSLDAVQGVRTARVGDRQVWFRLEASGGAQAVARAISLGRTLRASEGSGPGQFRLLP